MSVLDVGLLLGVFAVACLLIAMAFWDTAARWLKPDDIEPPAGHLWDITEEGKPGNFDHGLRVRLIDMTGTTVASEKVYTFIHQTEREVRREIRRVKKRLAGPFVVASRGGRVSR